MVWHTFAFLSCCTLKTKELVWNIHLVVFLLPLSYQDEWCTMQNGDNLSSAANSANFVEKSTTLQNFCKLPSGIHHIAEILKITMKNQPHCTIVGNYYERSAILHNFSQLRWKIHQSVDLKDCEVELRRAHIVKLFSYFQVLLELASSYWPMLKVCVSWEFVFRWFLYHH